MEISTLPRSFAGNHHNGDLYCQGHLLEVITIEIYIAKVICWRSVPRLFAGGRLCREVGFVQRVQVLFTQTTFQCTAHYKYTNTQ